MFAPKLYTIRKFGFQDIVRANFSLNLPPEEEALYYIKQGDSMLLRQIRLITYETADYNRFLIFVDCAAGKAHPDEMKRLIRRGFKINGQEFVASERSASMVRTAILSFVDKRIITELNKRISMEIDDTPKVLSKLYAYKGLSLSSCHCIEGWLPKMIVVPDCKVTIKDQHIKYVFDSKKQFVDKEGREREWVQKDIADKITDVKINAFDGCGIAHPLLMAEMSRRIGTDEEISTCILRGMYIKGVLHSMDYERFFAERGVTKIKDVWGQEYPVTPGSEPLIILTESMYKGLSYFKQDGTINDWNRYWELFKKYNHCIGVAKWNFQAKHEPLFTRLNYQVLQDLDLDYEDFNKLAEPSIEWYEKICSGDEIYTYCFLGLYADRYKALNGYCEAILKDPEMLKEDGVRNYIAGLLEKYRNEFKCGKLWLNATFKFIAPDLIMLMEHIGGLELKGCLESDEFFSFDRTGVFSGERLIERNPHICKSEHVILKATTNELIERYCGHLVNVAMINCKSITPQRLNGAD